MPSEKSGSRLHDLLQQPELSSWWRCALLGPWGEARQKEEGGILGGEKVVHKGMAVGGLERQVGHQVVEGRNTS